MLNLQFSLTGGSTLYIESTLSKPISDEKDAQGALQLTGQLGDVMKESAQIAYTFSKAFLTREDPKNEFLQKAQVHVHVPEVRNERERRD